MLKDATEACEVMLMESMKKNAWWNEALIEKNYIKKNNCCKSGDERYRSI